MQFPTWLIFALIAAVAAALTGIFAKVGMEGIDSTLATTIRAFVGMAYLVLFATYRQKWGEMKNLHPKAVLMIVLAGLAGATSWLFQYAALSPKYGGPVSKVAALDKMSVPIAVVLAVLLLKEKLLPINWMGVILIVVGAYLVAYRPATGQEFPVVTTQTSTPESHP